MTKKNKSEDWHSKLDKMNSKRKLQETNSIIATLSSTLWRWNLRWHKDKLNNSKKIKIDTIIEQWNFRDRFQNCKQKSRNLHILLSVPRTQLIITFFYRKQRASNKFNLYSILWKIWLKSINLWKLVQRNTKLKLKDSTHK